MKLTAEVTRRDYQVSIPLDAMLRLLESERVGGRVMLSERIDELPGVFDTDYNGHFGAAVFYRVNAEDDTPELHEQIFTLIREYVA